MAASAWRPSKRRRGASVGTSCAQVLAALMYAMQARRLRKGVTRLCQDGGQATAVAREMR